MLDYYRNNVLVKFLLPPFLYKEKEVDFFYSLWYTEENIFRRKIIKRPIGDQGNFENTEGNYVENCCSYSLL